MLFTEGQTLKAGAGQAGKEGKAMFWNAIKAIFTFVFASPVPTSGQRIGCVAGNGGWGDEDADHLKK